MHAVHASSKPDRRAARKGCGRSAKLYVMRAVWDIMTAAATKVGEKIAKQAF